MMLAKTGEGLMTARIGRSRIYGGDRDTLRRDDGHMSRCDCPGYDGIEATGKSSVDLPQLHGVLRQRSRHGTLQTQGVLDISIGSRHSTKSII